MKIEAINNIDIYERTINIDIFMTHYAVCNLRVRREPVNSSANYLTLLIEGS